VIDAGVNGGLRKIKADFLEGSSQKIEDPHLLSFLYYLMAAQLRVAEKAIDKQEELCPPHLAQLHQQLKSKEDFLVFLSFLKINGEQLESLKGAVLQSPFDVNFQNAFSWIRK